jgi:hypothetical protein
MLESISESDQEGYMKLLKSAFLIDKLTFKKFKERTTMIRNSFAPKILQFEKLTSEDKTILADLANSGLEEEPRGLKLYAKLMELEKTGKIYGDSIVKKLYIAFLE